MQGGRPPQPSGTNRPSSSACPSHGRSLGVLLARAVRPPGPGGHDPEAERPQTASGHGRGGTPGPIPNPEVKPPSADCTAGQARGRPGRRWPTGGVFARRGPAPSAGPLLICILSNLFRHAALLLGHAIGLCIIPKTKIPACDRCYFASSARIAIPWISVKSIRV